MKPSRPSPRFGFVASGPGFHVWEETRAEALHAAAALSGGAPVEARPVAAARRPGRTVRARRP